MSARIAVLASGGGSNVRALLDYLADRPARRGGQVTLVVSDRSDAGALERARADGIATETVVARDDGDALNAVLTAHRIDLVALAGYLRHVPADIVRRFRGRIVNVHPSLLPAFGGRGMYGLRVHRAVLAAGARVTGVTVHFVDEEYDRGPIVAQWPVPVFPSDTAEGLAARVLRIEHLLFPRVVDAIAAGRTNLGTGRNCSGADFTLLPQTDDALAHAVDLFVAP
ncbi:MAG: phosphoribosylglycinamide formyltransferase [Gemmatimonadaceae bacterium]